MPTVELKDLVRLQRNAEDIRNICILAHVDHGKTSLTDSLIATNGIISPKLAGKIRYLDSRPDEQLRGITMESSAISLYFSMLRRSAPQAEPEKKEYLINLIDSPGHIDFSSEVSTASRLCDGAMVLVDVVEGVCSQTVTVLRHTWVEQLKPILVFNKLDRLITELKMSPSEAYSHLNKLLEQVNAVIGSFYQGERMEEDLLWRERVEERIKASAAKEKERDKTKKRAETDSQAEDIEEFEEGDDEDLYFAPEKNNVIFCSATDGWAFTIRQFSGLYEKKLGIKRTTLEKVLWGDYYLDPKTKRVLGQKHLKGRNLKPMFVQLVLESIWTVYNATVGVTGKTGDPAMLEKITESLSITIPAYILRSRDPKNILSAIFSSWLPLSTAVLVSVIEYLPSPPAAQAIRLPDMLDDSSGASFVDPVVREAMEKFRSGKDDPVVAYVSKMVSVPESELPSKTRRGGGGTLTAEEARELARRKRGELAKLQAESNGQGDDHVSRVTNTFAAINLEDNDSGMAEEKAEPEHLIGFARLYSGTLSVGDSVYVLPPKFSPEHPHAAPEPHKVTITALYLLMGRTLESLETVPAGVVFGIGGLEGHVIKTGTLCSQLEGAVNLAGVSLSSPPIVRVALEPVNPADLNKMINGLKMLERSDPCAEYEVLPSGEHVILTAGELHLERCLKDLRERFARCEIQAGESIVPYRETTINTPEMAPPKNAELPRGTVLAASGSKQLNIRLRVRPLPAAVTDFLGKHSSSTKRLDAQRRGKIARTNDSEENNRSSVDAEDQTPDLGDDNPSSRVILSEQEFKKELSAAFSEEKDKDAWGDVMSKIVEFGPRRTGQNVLIDATSLGLFERLFPDLDESAGGSKTDDEERKRRRACLFSDKISYAFQLATNQGPLCQEPVQGIAVIIEDVTLTETGDEDIGRLTGEVIRLVRDAVAQGFLDWSPRILLAMYSCEIQASTEVLGRVYGVITRRRGRILSETMKEGTPFFTILSLLPVAESFGFSDEIRKRTSGAASPQLIFAGFEMLDEDPFWVPATEEELEDLGELADKENVAKRYMDRVRSRKGLVVKGKKLIKDAEKQKTLKR